MGPQPPQLAATCVLLPVSWHCASEQPDGRPPAHPQALDSSIAYAAALRQAVKAQGAEQLVILNPGVAVEGGLAAQVHIAAVHCQQQPAR